MPISSRLKHDIISSATHKMNFIIDMFDWLFKNIDIKLLLAIIGLGTAFYQYKKSKEEANSFRQQLISIVHHTEGIADELRHIGNFAQSKPFSTVDDVSKAIQAISYNAQALFFGLIETKIGGVPLKDDLEKKYSEWADLELERKILNLKKYLQDNKLPTTEGETQQKVPITHKS